MSATEPSPLMRQLTWKALQGFAQEAGHLKLAELLRRDLGRGQPMTAEARPCPCCQPP